MAILSLPLPAGFVGSGCACHEGSLLTTEPGKQIVFAKCPGKIWARRAGKKKKQINHSSQRQNCSISELTSYFILVVQFLGRKRHFLQKMLLETEISIGNLALMEKSLMDLCLVLLCVFLNKNWNFYQFQQHRVLLAGSIYKYKLEVQLQSQFYSVEIEKPLEWMRIKNLGRVKRWGWAYDSRRTWKIFNTAESQKKSFSDFFLLELFQQAPVRRSECSK